jgi:adenylate kinase family enzyme
VGDVRVEGVRGDAVAGCNDTMQFAILGNSGSGKSTLAAWLARRSGAPLLDLDTIAWQSDNRGVLRPEDAAAAEVLEFCAGHASWIVEGCYANLVRALLVHRPVLVLLDPGEAQCIANCLARPWESHKYESRAAQDERLPFLLTWVREYYSRDGEMSHASHAATYAAYDGPKHLLTRAPVLEPPEVGILAWLTETSENTE